MNQSFHAADFALRAISGHASIVNATADLTSIDLDHQLTRARITPREVLMIVAFWTFMWLLTAANGIMDPRGRGLQPVLVAAPVVLALIQCSLWAVVTPIVFSLCSRFSLERANWVTRILLFTAVGLVAAITVSTVIDYMRFHVLYPPRQPPPGRPAFDPGFITGLTRLWWLDDLIVYIAVLAAGFARDYFLRYRSRREEATLLLAQTSKLQAQLVEARLSALRSQLDPHFLFNTLHAVSALVERDPRGVRRMIARLSELLRHSLEVGDEQEVPLNRELQFLERYLEIMQIRFQGRLEVSSTIDDEVRDAFVPSLVLQTLVENAVKYGVNQQDGSGRIEVSARRDGDRLLLSVRDHGPGISPDDIGKSPGVGLKNARERLAQLYGTDQSLVLQPVDGGGTDAIVSLPFHTAADLKTTGEMVRPW